MDKITNKPCSKCGEVFILTPSRVRRWDYICNPCKTKYRHANGYKGGKKTKACRNAYNKIYFQDPKNRKHRADLMKKYRVDPKTAHKHKARDLLRKAVKRGTILKEPCKFCGDVKSEGHHEDYYKPLEVTWICRKCHLELHTMEKSEREIYAWTWKIQTNKGWEMCRFVKDNKRELLKDGKPSPEAKVIRVKITEVGENKAADGDGVK